jgi:pSer/pThr/pTyr-binding forkhead associated (FHA) protein
MSNIDADDNLERAVLHVDGGAESGTSYVLETKTLAGRSSKADLHLSDQSISGQHFEIMLSAGGTGLRVLSSRKTIIVDDEEVSETRLYDGNVITLPPYTFTFKSTRAVDRKIAAVSPVVITSPTIFGDAGTDPTMFSDSESREFEVEIYKKDELVLHHTVADRRITIGRSSNCDICLNDAVISRNHAELNFDGTGLSIKRLSKSRPLFVNGDPVETAALGHGDTIGLDPFTLRIGGSPGAVAEAAPPISASPTKKEMPKPDNAAAEIPAATEGPEAWLVLEASGKEYPLVDGQNMIGRAHDAEIRLDDAYVSNHHAEITLGERNCRISNKSETGSIEVRGEVTKRSRLYDGDSFKIDENLFVFRSVRKLDQPQTDVEATLFRGTDENAGDKTAVRLDEESSSPVEADDRTILPSPSSSEPTGPRLLLSAKGGENTPFDITTRSISVGRAEDCDLQVDDPAVSRRQLLIELKDGNYQLQAYADANPTMINGEKASEARLYSGDQIQIGSSNLIFLSNREEDIRQAESSSDDTAQPAPQHPYPYPPYPPEKKSGGGKWFFFTLLILGGMGYFGYTNYLVPWQQNRELDAVEIWLADGNTGEAENALNTFSENLTPFQVPPRGREQWVRLELLQVKKHEESGKYTSARDHVQGFLDRFGAWDDAEPLRKLLDDYHFRLGNSLRRKGNALAAIQELSAIRSGSEHHAEAMKLTSTIWLDFQKKKIAPVKQDTSDISEFLRKADLHFQKKQYLTPASGNAYGYYSLVLERDPRNSIALNRIDSIKDFYVKGAGTLMSKGEFEKAADFYRRYLLIDPSSTDILNRLAVAKASAVKSASSDKAPADKPANATTSRLDRERARLKALGFDPDYVLEFLGKGQSPKKKPGKKESPFDDSE